MENLSPLPTANMLQSSCPRHRLVKPPTRFSVRIYARAYKEGRTYKIKNHLLASVADPMRRPTNVTQERIIRDRKENPIIVDGEEEENPTVYRRLFAVNQASSCVPDDWITKYFT